MALKSNLQTHKWSDVVPNYDSMSKSDQARARAKWWIDNWGDKIKGIENLTDQELDVALNNWDLQESERKQLDNNQKDIADITRKAKEEEERIQKRHEEIQRAYEAKMHEIQQRAEENKKLSNQVQAMQQSKTNAIRQRANNILFDDKPAGGKSEFGGVGGSLLTNKGQASGQKLGGRKSLGGKSLLGG